MGREAAGRAIADPARFLAELGRALRLHGIGVTLRDELDACGALVHVDGRDEAEVRLAWRIALRVPREAWQTFDRLFAACWRGVPSLPSSSPPPRPPAADRPAARGRLLAWDPERRQMGGEPGAAPEGEEAGWSPEALLRRKAFDRGDWSPAEIAAMERLLARLARKVANRRGRRLVPTRGRGLPDLRASFRRALATAGEPLALARRARARDRLKLVLLCDTSGSMDACGRFLLAFVLALGRAVPGAHAFAFNTELVHLTAAGGGSALLPGKVAQTLERLAAAVPDWSGGTRIGECLSSFPTQHAGLLDGTATVVVLSDGLDRGDSALLAESVRRIRSRARRLVWLNPLAGDPRYRPEAAGMAAALPFVDHFAAAHDLASLERFVHAVSRPPENTAWASRSSTSLPSAPRPTASGPT